MIKNGTIEDLRKEAEYLEDRLRAINALIGLYSESEMSNEDTSVVPIKRRGRKTQHA